MGRRRIHIGSHPSPMLKYLRELHGMTLQEVASLSGLSTSSINRWEDGQTLISWRGARKLARVFRVHPVVTMCPMDVSSKQIEQIANDLLSLRNGIAPGAPPR